MSLKDKIESFRDLQRDWNSYGAEPLSKRTIEFAIHMVDCVPVGAWQVVPCADGTIQFEDGDRTICVYGGEDDDQG